MLFKRNVPKYYWQILMQFKKTKIKFKELKEFCKELGLYKIVVNYKNLKRLSNAPMSFRES